eukprot:gb/GECG01007511.1/.p1 GENE.gb/GECG01007511.1/~~gb/GECG01007511.1/.p1  ORF type:complete len:360 (+),score=37.50 gb/GECG01007511.1/:1-1080(+)
MVLRLPARTNDTLNIRALIRKSVAVFVYGYFFAVCILVLGLYALLSWMYFPRIGAFTGVIGLISYYIWVYLNSSAPKRPPSYSEKGLQELGDFLDPLCSFFPIHVEVDDEQQDRTDNTTWKESKENLFDPEETYIFGVHPHGIHATGGLIFRNPHSPFYRGFPQLRGKIVDVVASVMFLIPFVRELFLWMGYRDCSRHVCERILQEGYSLSIVIGGEEESLQSAPGTDRIVLRKRKGFVKLALKYGAKLVPTYTFGNTDLFQTYGILSSFRMWLAKNFYICLPIYHGPWFSMFPYQRPLVVAVGRPIDVEKAALNEKGGLLDESLVNKYHERYMEALTKLYERFKDKGGYSPSRKLEII